MRLSVIDEVTHVDEELGILIALPGGLSHRRPTAVIAGLGIGEDEGLEAAAFGRMEGRPGTAFVAVTDAVFISRARCKVGNCGRVDIGRHAVIVEGVAGSG